MADKIAIVTGATGGIGSEIARLLAAAGMTLVLLERGEDKAKQFAASLNAVRAGTVTDVFGIDLASHDDIRRVTVEILTRHPRIDYLFNNAGVLTETLQFSKLGNELHFEVNTLAPLQLVDQLRPALKAAGKATIINTSAGIASGVKALDWAELVRPANFQNLFGPYVRSKQALNVLTAALAPELRTDGIFIRTADPGPTRTRLTQGAGTPLWMRLFYWALPGPATNARKIVDAALARGWQEQSGISISGGKLQALPPTLADPQFQAVFLERCREHVVHH